MSKIYLEWSKREMPVISQKVKRKISYRITNSEFSFTTILTTKPLKTLNEWHMTKLKRNYHNKRSEGRSHRLNKNY